MDAFSIITVVITFILGVITGVYLPLKFRKDDKKPNISVSPFQERQNFVSVTNHGGDLLDMKIEISWMREGKQEKRDLQDFFNSDEDPTFGHPHKCNSIKRGETKKATNCPMYSDDGKINVAINGKDLEERKYDTNITVNNLIKK